MKSDQVSTAGENDSGSIELFFLSLVEEEKKMKGRKAVTADSILMCGSVIALINRGEPAKACVTSRKNYVCMNVCVQARVCHRFCFC